MGGRTPGSKLPASSPPLPRPDGGGNHWPCTCVHGPKNSSRHAMNRTIWNETSTITRQGDASTRAAHWSRRVSAFADAEHADTTAAVASMVLTVEVTVKDIAAGSTAGAVDTDVPQNFPLKTGTARGMLIPMPRSEGRQKP